MSCEMVKVGNTVAIVCGRGPKRRRCAFCTRWSTRLCDGPPRRPETKSCDAPICDDCATRIGENRDLCPRCVQEGKQAVQQPLAL